MSDPLTRDAPGDMVFGETVIIRSILPEEKGVTVVFGVFGSHVEGVTKYPVEEDDNRTSGNMNARVFEARSKRRLCDKQKEYLSALTVLAAGVAMGWLA